jgi:hypothetical protein
MRVVLLLDYSDPCPETVRESSENHLGGSVAVLGRIRMAFQIC